MKITRRQLRELIRESMKRRDFFNKALKHLRQTPDTLMNLTTKSVYYFKTTKLGQTINRTDDTYLFLCANPGDRKISSGHVEPSQGMGRHQQNDTAEEAEYYLESMRNLSFHESVPRQGSVFLTPRVDGGGWSTYGSDVFLVKIPGGSKMTYVDGGWATETHSAIQSCGIEAARQDNCDEANSYALEYWGGDGYGKPMSTNMELEEVITKAPVKVIGNINDIFTPEQINFLINIYNSESNQ